MAASASVDLAGVVKVTSLLNCVNVNTNTGTAAFDISPYIGTLMVIVNAGNDVSGAVLVPQIKAGADTNLSNATNFVVNATNFSNVADQRIINVDLRASGFGGSTNKFMYLNWLTTGSATANRALDATVIGQQKYSS